MRLRDLFKELKKQRKAAEIVQQAESDLLLQIKEKYGSTFSYRGKTYQIRTPRARKDRKRAPSRPFMVELTSCRFTKVREKNPGCQTAKKIEKILKQYPQLAPLFE